MNNTDVPIWEKYTLTIEEASKYFRIGEKKLRKLAEENIDAGWVIAVSYTHLLSTSTRPTKKKSLNFACRTPTG